MGDAEFEAGIVEAGRGGVLVVVPDAVVETVGGNRRMPVTATG